jgi:hypothetical protein
LIQVLEDLVKSSGDAWPSAQYVKSPYLLSIFHNKADVSREKERVDGLDPLSGTQPPISEAQEYQFLDANLFDLAKFTLEAFPDGHPISNRYMLIVDERSVRDRTCQLVEIPEQVELDSNMDVVKKDRKFNKRDQYTTDPKGWLDEQGDYTDTEELKMVRVTFEYTNTANMLDDGNETIGFMAQHTYQTDGVFNVEAAYPDNE